MLIVYILNTQQKKEYPFGTSLIEIAKKENIKLKYTTLGALVNNKVRDMSYRIYKSIVISFFDITNTHGHDMYCRSVYFMLFKAVGDLLPQANLKILHSISAGKYCELENIKQPIDQEIIEKIENRMQELTALNLPFTRDELFTPQALDEFRKYGMDTKAELFEDRRNIFTSVYHLDNRINYYYGALVASTGIVDTYKLELYGNGLLLKLPSQKMPTNMGTTRQLPKLFAVYKQYKQWVQELGVPYLKDINKKIEHGEINDFILISEAFHEKLLANMADQIHQRRDVKVVLLSGPSSSGKTTTCKRLSVQLGVLGYKPVQISVDDFFVEREDTPKDENGNFNFEAIEAIDLDLFNNTIKSLLAGEKVEIPTFNFALGKKEWKGNKLKMEDQSILVIEGIHCLNPQLTSQIDDSRKFKIFASALISLSIDSQNPIPTSDNRLLRRLIRDYKYRGYSALDTLKRWESVRAGESKYIFPFQENADVMFNTSLLCELGVLKKYAIPILQEVPQTEPEFAEARRLLKFLSFVESIPDQAVPPGSILREFVGGSNFEY